LQNVDLFISIAICEQNRYLTTDVPRGTSFVGQFEIDNLQFEILRELL